MTKKKACKKGCVNCDECLVKQKMKKMKLAKAKASLKLKNPIVKQVIQQVPSFDWMRALPPQQKQRIDKTLTLDELRHEIQQALNSRPQLSQPTPIRNPLFGGALSPLQERIKDNVRSSPLVAEPEFEFGGSLSQLRERIRERQPPSVDVQVAPFFGFGLQPQKGSIREVASGFQPSVAPLVAQGAERRKTSESEFGFGEQLRETINELQPHKGYIREIAPFIEEPSEFFDIERESQPSLIRQQDYEGGDDNQPLQYISPYAEGDEKDEPEEEKQSLFSRAKKSLFGFLNDAVEPEAKIPRSFRKEKEEMKEELAEEDVGETKDDLPPAFSRVVPPPFSGVMSPPDRFSRTESLIEADDEDEFEDAEGDEQQGLSPPHRQDAGFGDAPIVAQGAVPDDDEPLPQLEVPLLQVEDDELASTSTFQPIDDEPLPPPFVPLLYAQPDYEQGLSPPHRQDAGFGDAVPDDNDPLPYIEEEFNFGISPEEIASSSAMLTGYKKAEAENEPAVFKPLKEMDEDEFNRQTRSALGGDMIFIKPAPLLFGGEEEKPKTSKVTIKDVLQRGAREKAAAEAAEEPSGKKRGRPAGAKGIKTIAKEQKAAKGQTSIFSVFPTQANTDPLEIVETSSGRADVEGVRQEKQKESPFIPDAEATFMPEAKITSKSSLEKEKES